MYGESIGGALKERCASFLGLYNKRAQRILELMLE